MSKDVTCILKANTSKRIIDDFLFLLQTVEQNGHPIHSIEVSEDRVFVQQKHGKWIEESDRRFHWHCSECGYVIGVIKMDCNYCPKCGAKMDGGTEDE